MSPLPDPPQMAESSRTELAVALVQQAALLSRVVFAHLDVQLSRTEAGVLARLGDGPLRITALAELDGLAQPTMTLVVKHLETEGLVQRDRSATDRRVVNVSLTDDGAALLTELRRRYREVLAHRLAELPERDVAALAPALSVVNQLIAHLQSEEVGESRDLARVAGA